MNAYERLPSNLVSCQNLNFYSQVDKVVLYQPDLYIFIIFASIGCFLNLIIIGLNMKNPLMRKRPGDLFFGLAVAEFILSSHWLVSALNQYLGGVAVYSGDLFCQINAFFSIMAGQFEFFYNMCIYIYVICAVRNMRIIKVVKMWHVHFIIINLSIFIAIFMKLLGYVGKTMFGTCSIRSDNAFPIKGIGLLVIYIFISLSTLMYLNYKLPRIQKYQKLLKFYQLYMYSCIVTWSLLIISHIMIYLNCRYIHVNFVNIFVTIGNICKIVTTIFLPIIRITDPNIRLILRSIFKIKKTLPKKIKQDPPQPQLNITSTTPNNNNNNGNTTMMRNIKSHLMSNSSITMEDELQQNDTITPNNYNNQKQTLEMMDFNKINTRGGAISQQLQGLQGQSIQMSLILQESMVESINLEDYMMDNAMYEQDKSKSLFNNDNIEKTPNSFTGDRSKRQTITQEPRGYQRQRMGSNYSEYARQSVDLSGNYYDTLNNSQRESILYRMLSGIILSDRRKNRIFNIDIQSVRGESIYDQKKIYTLDDKLILEELSGIPKKCLELQQFDNIRMISYCPLLFQSLIERDRVNIEKSLDLIANKNDIIIAARESNNPNARRTSTFNRQNSQFKGSSSQSQSSSSSSSRNKNKTNFSGDINQYMELMEDAKQKNQRMDDYIFFSNDKQIIIKTISKKQLKYLLDIIKDYYSHIKQNPQSLLMKIYGVFEFKGLDNNDLYIILMKNIAPCPSSFIKRKFDLKGCTYNRQVIANYPTQEGSVHEPSLSTTTRGIKTALSANLYAPDTNQSSNQYPIQVSEEIDCFYSSLLLKDLDFINLENHLLISHSNKEGLLQILERDVLFMIRNGLINYSLMVIKVDWEKYRQNFNQDDPKSLSHIPQYLRNQFIRMEESSYSQLQNTQSKPSIDSASMTYFQSLHKNDWSMSLQNNNIKDKVSIIQNSNQEIGNISNQVSSINQNNNVSSLSETSSPFVASALESESEPGVFYMLGIIDFLHKYTLSKRITKYSKIIKNMNTKLDQSSSNANLYSQRFLHFCKNIINLPLPQELSAAGNEQYY